MTVSFCGDAHQAVVIHGDARERGHGLGLRAAGEHDELFGVEAADILWPDDAAVRNTQFAEAVRDLDVVHHAAPDETDFASHAARDVNHLLDAVDRAGKTGDDDFFRSGAEQLFHAHDDGALRGREPRALDVGAVAEEREHSFLTVAREGVQVERLSIHGSRIHFVIAGVDDDSNRRADRERDAIDRAMGHVQVFDLERPDLGDLAGRDFVELRRIEQGVFFEFFSHQRERELRAVYRARSGRRGCRGLRRCGPRARA